MIFHKLISSLPAYQRTSKRINGLIRNSCVLLIAFLIFSAFSIGSGLQKTNSASLALSKDTVKEYTGVDDSIVLINTTNDTVVIDTVAISVDTSFYPWQLQYFTSSYNNPTFSGNTHGKSIRGVNYKIPGKNKFTLRQFLIDCSLVAPTAKRIAFLKQTAIEAIRPITAQIILYQKTDKDTFYLTGDYDSNTCKSSAIKQEHINQSRLDNIYSYPEYYSINGVKMSHEELMDTKSFYHGIYICKANGHVFLKIK